MFQWSALYSREYSFVKVEFLCILCTAQDHTSSWSTKSLVSRCRCHMSIWNRAWMQSCCNKTCNMSHIYHQICACFVCNLTEFFKINDSCISTCPCNNKLRLFFYRSLTNHLVIDHAFFIDTIGHNIKIFSRNIDRWAVCQMSAVIQIHSHYFISRLQHCKKYCQVCLCSWMWLNICILTAK